MYFFCSRSSFRGGEENPSSTGSPRPLLTPAVSSRAALPRPSSLSRTGCIRWQCQLYYRLRLLASSSFLLSPLLVQLCSSRPAQITRRTGTSMSTPRRRLSASTPSDSLHPTPIPSRSSSTSPFTLNSSNQQQHGGSPSRTAPRPSSTNLYPPQFGGTGRKPSNAAFILRETVKEGWDRRRDASRRTIAVTVAGLLALWFAVVRM